MRAPLLCASMVVPAPHILDLSPWVTVFANFIRGAYINNSSCRLPTGILHQLGLLTHSHGARLIGESSTARPFLYVCFLVLSMSLAGASWIITLVFYIKVVYNYISTSTGLRITVRRFISAWSHIFSLLEGFLSVTHFYILLSREINGSWSFYFTVFE